MPIIPFTRNKGLYVQTAGGRITRGADLRIHKLQNTLDSNAQTVDTGSEQGLLWHPSLMKNLSHYKGLEMNEQFFDEQDDIYAGMPNVNYEEIMAEMERQYEIHLINQELHNDESE